MKLKFLYLFAFLLFAANVFSQGTDRYNEYVKQLKPLETKPFTTKYKNGNVKRTGFITTYMIDSVKHDVYTGKFVKYYKNGNKDYELFLDPTGISLRANHYISGKLYSKSETVELDTNATNFNDFFFGFHTSIIYNEEIYRIDKNNMPILWKKGNVTNKKRTGVWTTYKNGKPIKTKTYKKRDKFVNMPKINYLELNLND